MRRPLGRALLMLAAALRLLDPTLVSAEPSPPLAAQAATGAAELGPVQQRIADGGDRGRYGSPAIGMPFDREIRLGAQPRAIGVWRLETINFVAADGRSFRWRFDTVRQLDSFPLARIAPADVAVPGDARVYVNGEIPVAP